MTSTGIYDLAVSSRFWRNLLNPGDAKARFLGRLKEVSSCKEIIATDSGRTALFLALHGLGCRGKEVLVNAYTTDVVHRTIEAAGAEPVYFDIDPITLQPDLEDLSGKVNENTGAAIHTGLFGFPCNPDKFTSFFRGIGVPVIEDACNSLGCETDGSASGSFGDMVIFSFRVGKPLSSGGGALGANGLKMEECLDVIAGELTEVSKAGDILRTARVLLDHMMLNPIFLRYVARPIRRATKGTRMGRLLIRGGVVDTSSLPSFEKVEGMGTLQSLMASCNIELFREWTGKRRLNAVPLRKELSSAGLLPVAEREFERWNGLFLPFLLPSDNIAGEMVEFCRRRGFDISRFHYEVPLISMEEEYRKSFPGSAELSDRLICLPVPRRERDRAELTATVSEFLEARKNLSSV